MFELLTGFAALSVLAGMLTALLPEGSLRRTACMVVGLLMLMYWYDGLQTLTGLFPGFSGAPSPILAPTGISLPDPSAEVQP